MNGRSLLLIFGKHLTTRLIVDRFTKRTMKLPDIAEKAETFTVLVGCWG